MVLEFDHIGRKSFSIAVGIRGHNWKSVLDEIDRCDVVLRELPSSPNRASSGLYACGRSRTGPHTADAYKRATGIEPALKAWKAFVQPKHFARAAV
jgi:hypothetical protein